MGGAGISDALHAGRGNFQGAFGAIWSLASAVGSSTPFQPPRTKADIAKLFPGPVIGGALATKNYRWLFYLNLPLTGGVIAIVAFFMNLKTPPGTMKEKLSKMDWYEARGCFLVGIHIADLTLFCSVHLLRVGNFIFVPCIT